MRMRMRCYIMPLLRFLFISVHDRFNTVTVEIGSFYRPPNAKIESLENLQSSMTNINEHNKEKPIFLAGDFNLPHINWEN